MGRKHADTEVEDQKLRKQEIDRLKKEKHSLAAHLQRVQDQLKMNVDMDRENNEAVIMENKHLKQVIQRSNEQFEAI